MTKERDIFQELGRNKRWKDFCNEHAPAGMFYEMHDDVFQSLIADIIEDFLLEN